MEVRLAESALDDLEGILLWYKQEKVPEVGQRLVDQILKRTDQIVQHPHSGRIVPEFQNPDLRELIQSPFRIVYMLEDDTCFVIRVWRSERVLDLEGIFDDAQVSPDFMEERIDSPAQERDLF